MDNQTGASDVPDIDCCLDSISLQQQWIAALIAGVTAPIIASLNTQTRCIQRASTGVQNAIVASLNANTALMQGIIASITAQIGQQQSVTVDNIAAISAVIGLSQQQNQLAQTALLGEQNVQSSLSAMGIGIGGAGGSAGATAGSAGTATAAGGEPSAAAQAAALSGLPAPSPQNLPASSLAATLSADVTPLVSLLTNTYGLTPQQIASILNCAIPGGPPPAGKAAQGSVPAAPLALETTTAPDAIDGEYYSFQLIADGGTPPYRFSCTGLPDGLQCSESGLISGIPTVSGEYPLAITVDDAGSLFVGGS